MKTKDVFEFLRIVSGPIAMWVAAVAAMLLGNWFAAAIATVASIGWAVHVINALERHTTDVRECLQMVDKALVMARQYSGMCDRYAEMLRASDVVSKRFYDIGQADACERVNELLAKHGSSLRVTYPDDEHPN